MVKIHKGTRIRQTPGSKIFDICNIIIMLLVALVTLYPIYNVLIVSISGGMAVQAGQVQWLPKDINFKAYQRVFENPDLLRSYGNTILYTVLGTAINMVLTILCAYPLSRRNFYGKRFFTLLVVIPMYISGGMIPTYLLVSNLGMIDTIWSIVLPGAISTWNMVIMRTFFQSLPETLFEAARIDGAREGTILRKLVLPLSKPIVVTMIMFYAVGHWNSFFNAILYLNSKAKYPVQVLMRNIVIANQLSEFTAEYGASFQDVISLNIKYAVVIVVIVPILCIYPFVQKYFMKGMMVGSLKG